MFLLFLLLTFSETDDTVLSSHRDLQLVGSCEEASLGYSTLLFAGLRTSSFCPADIPTIIVLGFQQDLQLA